MVEAVLSESEYKVNEGKAVLLREYTGKLTPERAEQILSGEFSRKTKKIHGCGVQSQTGDLQEILYRQHHSEGI